MIITILSKQCVFWTPLVYRHIVRAWNGAIHGQNNKKRINNVTQQTDRVILKQEMRPRGVSARNNSVSLLPRPGKTTAYKLYDEVTLRALNVFIKKIIWIPIWWLYGHYKYVYSFSAGSNLDVRFWRLKSIPALKGLIYNVTVPAWTCVIYDISYYIAGT